MTRLRIVSLAWLLIAATLTAHEGHERDGSFKRIADSSQVAADAVSGDGEMRFRVYRTADMMPAAARAVLENAHGGFAVDRTGANTGVYFALAAAGIVRLNHELTAAHVIETPRELLNTNAHNTTFWVGADGEARLTFSANDAGKIFTTTTDGTLVHTLSAPDAEAFDVEAVRRHFAKGGAFVPTAAETVHGRMYVTTGYSPLDYVLTATVADLPELAIDWDSLAFGGKGEQPGQFDTSHGITAHEDILAVSDRAHGEIDRFDFDGNYRSTVSLPEGSFPCEIDYLDDVAVVASLFAPDREKGAPIYILREDRVISTVWPKEELGLANFQHVHNAVLHRVDARYYIIAQAWNPGDFAVLEQVE